MQLEGLCDLFPGGRLHQCCRSVDVLSFPKQILWESQVGMQQQMGAAFQGANPLHCCDIDACACY